MLTPEEIAIVMSCTAPLEEGWFDHFISKSDFKDHKKFYRKSKVIELGPSSSPNVEAILSMGAAEYTAVEPLKFEKTVYTLKEYLGKHPEHGGVFAFEEDGLTFLRKRENDSHIIISNMVLVEGLIGCYLDKAVQYKGVDPRVAQELIEQYKRELVAEIYNITPPGQISFHPGIAPLPDLLSFHGELGWHELFLEQGFIEIDRELYMKPK